MGFLLVCHLLSSCLHLRLDVQSSGVYQLGCFEGLSVFAGLVGMTQLATLVIQSLKFCT